MQLDPAAASVVIAVFAAAWVATGLVRRWLIARAILDRPVARSSHRAPVPRGAGLALVPVLAAGALALVLAGAAPAGTALTAAIAVALGAISWRDDVRGLPIVVRLAAQALAVGIGLAAWPGGAVFQGALPPRSIAPRRGCSGSGSSISTISWTGSTASPAWRPRRSASASRWCWPAPAEPATAPRRWPSPRRRRRWASCAGTGTRRGSFSAMSAACRWATSWAGCCCCSPARDCGRRR